MVSGLGTISGDNKDTSSISLMSVQGKVDPTRMQDLTILSPLTTVQMKEPEQSPPTNSSEVLGSQIHQPESVVHTSLSEDMKDFKPSQGTMSEGVIGTLLGPLFNSVHNEATE